MKTMVNKTSSSRTSSVSALESVLCVCALIGLGVAIAYMNGALEGENTATSGRKAHADFQIQPNHAKQLINDDQWKALVSSETRALQDTSKSLERRTGETEQHYKTASQRAVLEPHSTSDGLMEGVGAWILSDLAF